jgi:hypothetical protein
MQYGIWTLDSHEYYGPFTSEATAHLYAQFHMHFKSYQIVEHLSRPEYETNWRK